MKNFGLAADTYAHSHTHVLTTTACTCASNYHLTRSVFTCTSLSTLCWTIWKERVLEEPGGPTMINGIRSWTHTMLAKMFSCSRLDTGALPPHNHTHIKTITRVLTLMALLCAMPSSSTTFRRYSFVSASTTCVRARGPPG